jgi:3-(3-hydroxy-phenyl)propionate hydroxylase
VGGVFCEGDGSRARLRDASLLDACQGIVQDTPRQDMPPALEDGLITATPGAGTLFPQPRLAAPSGGLLMDQRHGYGFRWVSDGTLSAPTAEIRVVDLAREPETEGVVAAWFARHRARVALVRPDHYVFGSAADASGMAALLAAFHASALGGIQPSFPISSSLEAKR